VETRRPTNPAAEEILGLYFPVLDHGFVALVDYMGSDEDVERAARVSYGYGTRRTSETRGLIRYLRRHRHTTPSEMVELKFHCCMPIFVARQWIRHRTACLSGDTALVFDLPGAEERRRRQSYRVSLEKFHRLWHEGTTHVIAKKKPLFPDRVDPEKRYSVPELASLVQRRPEDLRNLVRWGRLQADRISAPARTQPAIFVRGIDWHRYAARIHWARVPMQERLAGMQLRMCDESTGEIKHTEVVDVWQNGVKPVFKVTLENGYSIKMTKDHRCLTERGWMTLDEAAHPRLGAHGCVTWDGGAPAFAVNGVRLYQSREWLAEQRKAGSDVTRIAELAGTSYHTIRKYLKHFGLQFSTSERSRLSGVAQSGTKRTITHRRVFTDDHLRIIREARSGHRSNFWKGGITPERANIGRWTVEHAARVHAKYGFRCVVCGSSHRLHAHHADPVWHNPARGRDFENLVTLCGSCHSRIHRHNLELEFLAALDGGAVQSFWDGRVPAPRPSGKRRPRAAKLARTFVRIAQIEFAGDEMTYDVEVSGPYHNFVANGFIVHNSLNEYSGRYSLLPLLFYRPEAEQFQAQSATNRQGRAGETLTGVYADALERWERTRREAAAQYEWLVAQDVARELARIDLPLSTYTQWYWKIDLHNLFHFLSVRADAHAQYEIRVYARVMAGMLKRVAPLSFEAWLDYELGGAHLSRAELAALRKLVRVVGRDLEAQPGARLAEQDLVGLGLAKREIDELLPKLAAAPPAEDFELDLAAARSPEHFAHAMEAAVPRVDRPK